MKYLITGITGFVGPHLANLLIDEGHEVWGLSRAGNGRENDICDVVPDEKFNRIKFIFGDITHRQLIMDTFAKEQFDGVFHLAAQSHPPISFMAPLMTFDINATGSANIVDAILKYQPECRFMMCSTSEVYGVVDEDKQPITENHPICPINPYGVSKAAADLYVRERAQSLEAPLFVTRAFSHTGTRRGKIFSISSDAYQIVRIQKGLQEPTIKVGTLSSKRAVINARDCVRAYYLLMNSFEPGQAYNIGGEVVYSIGDLLDMMLDISGLKDKVTLEPDPALIRPIDIPVQMPDSTKCHNLTKWEPQIPIKQTLTDLLDYWNAKITPAEQLTEAIR